MIKEPPYFHRALSQHVVYDSFFFFFFESHFLKLCSVTANKRFWLCVTNVKKCFFNLKRKKEKSQI